MYVQIRYIKSLNKTLILIILNCDYIYNSDFCENLNSSGG